MLSRRSVCTPVFISLAITCAMGIMLLGGCPQQQIPSPAPTQEPNTTTTPTDTTNVQPERPIPGPVIDANTPGSPSQPTGGDTSNDTTSGGGTVTPPPTLSVRFSAPLSPVAVRPGTKVDLTFRLTDTNNVVNDVQFVVARDNNQDQQPDGDPISAQTITVTSGTSKATYDTGEAPLGSTGFGRFLLGLRVTTTAGQSQTSYASGIVTIDNTPPTAEWISPTQDKLTSPVNQQVKIRTGDNSPHTVRILLDNDTNPTNGYAGILVNDTQFPAGSGERDFDVPLSISSGTYYYYVVVSDGIDPPTAFYAPKTNPPAGTDPNVRLAVTSRLVGDFDLNQLDPASPLYNNFDTKSKGAILQGFNFNDLSGSSMVSVPDVNGDGANELVIGARFGKPNLSTFQGQGWGEAYMVYGTKNQRLRGTQVLNSVGGAVPGVTFRGIRVPQGTAYTLGLSDITVLRDMDGDDLPELVFSFPRVESLSLHTDPPFQHPDLVADVSGMGNMEYDSAGPTWLPNKAQFTRGGIVIVSSHNAVVTDATAITRKFDRVLDLHEIGQMFSMMGRPGTKAFIRAVEPADPKTGCIDCIPQVPEACVCGDPNNACETGCGQCGGIKDNSAETGYTSWIVKWDVWNGDFRPQGPGGFQMPWTIPMADPPLALPTGFSAKLPDPADVSPCDTDPPGACKIHHQWWRWYEENNECTGAELPLTNLACNDAWIASWNGADASVWTGFYGDSVSSAVPLYYVKGDQLLPPTSIGARLLGQSVDDLFGTAVSTDGTFLYISAPSRAALKADVPTLSADRPGSGVVYQMRIDERTPGGKNLGQLWVEPGFRPDPNDPNGTVNDPNAIPLAWPYCDAELPNRLDYTIPTPHQYIIKTVGSWRMHYGPKTFDVAATTCVPASSGQVFPADAEAGVVDYVPYPTGSAGYRVKTVPEIVGPHVDAHISIVRGVADVNGDGNGDFAIGSADVQDPANPGSVVGAVYIVYGRLLGLQGDLLLENLQRDVDDPSRLSGVMLKGSSPGEKLGRVLDQAGDVNGDGYDDVIVGNENGNGGTGEAIVVFGSRFLQSPLNGWTPSDIVNTGHAVRFTGEANGDLAGANVAGAGDIDRDGLADILIAAPNAAAGRGVVYLIYGSPELAAVGEISLSKIGTFDLPGAKFIGRVINDHLGGGVKTITAVLPDQPNQPFTIYSRGVASLGDIDGDGRADYAISSMLAAPNGRREAGEVYILYGR